MGGSCVAIVPGGADGSTIDCLITELLDDSLGLMWQAMREMRLPGLHGMFRKPPVTDDEPVFRMLFLRSFHDIQSPVGFSTSKMVTPSIG
jgi:hypothetical protein